MNVNTSEKERESAPSWSISWGRAWGKRDKEQYERTVLRCEPCAKQKRPDRGFWQYAYPGVHGHQYVLECGHFIKQGAPLPQEA